MKKMMTFKKPAIVAIEFLDHAQHTNEGHASPIKCEVFGILHREDKDCYYVASWISDGTIDHNTDQYAIIKSTVKKVRKLRVAK